MKKITLFTLIIFSTSLSAQKTFLNESASEIEKYWQSKTAYENIHIFKDENGKIAEIDIMVGNIGNPSFIAQFDEKGKCAISISLFKDVKITAVTSNMKQNGYIYNKKEKAWYNDKKKIAIQIDDLTGENCQMTAQSY